MNDFAVVLAELMAKYNEHRDAAMAKLGDRFNQAEFDAWFTSQVPGLNNQ